MLRTALLTVSLCAASALFAFDAGAAPVTRFKQQLAVESYTTLVRDGCGRGMRFSNRQQTCVEQFDDGPRDRGRRDDGPDAGAAAIGTVLDIIGGSLDQQREGQQRQGQQDQRRQGGAQRGRRQMPGADGQED